MSSEQMSYWYKAALSAQASNIDNMTMAFARVMAGDKDTGKKINQSLDKMRGALTKELIRMK